MTASGAVPSLRQALLDVPRLTPGSWRRLGWLRRWLITSRAAVLPLTLCSALFGGLLALPWTPQEGARLMLVTAALVFAHATSNLLNDAVDWLRGLDRDSYFRVRYGAHPLAQGLISPWTFAVMLLATGGAAVLLGLAVCRQAGAPAYWLAGAGALLLLFYTWPLKRLGLGEIAVFLVWGPMMAGGTYWVVSGDWGAEIAALTAIFGLGAAVVVFAKHTDKRRDDAARGIHTLPVLLGPRWAPRLLALLALSQMSAGIGWAWMTSSWAYLLLLLALPALGSLVHICLRRRPTARPQRYPQNLWPLWYTVAGFRFARMSGLALVAAALVHGAW